MATTNQETNSSNRTEANDRSRIQPLIFRACRPRIRRTVAWRLDLSHRRRIQGEQGVDLQSVAEVLDHWLDHGQRPESRDKKGSRCQNDPPVMHGPNDQWTSKVDGKTKTIRLSKSDVDLFKQLLANGRRLEQIVGEWLQTSMQAAQEVRQISRR